MSAPSERAPAFPNALAEDDDDVTWALETARIEWLRGAAEAALVWLERAADSADRLGQVWRAADLRRARDELVAHVAATAAEQRAVDALLEEDDGADRIPSPAPELTPRASTPEVELDGEFDAADFEAAEQRAFPPNELPTEPSSVPAELIARARAGDEITRREGGGEAADPAILDVKLAEVAGLEDLPVEEQLLFVRSARLSALQAGDESTVTGLCLIVEGVLRVMPATVDAACATMRKGEVVWVRGGPGSALELRLEAGEHGARLAEWDGDFVEQALRDCPWVIDELRPAAERLQALCAVAAGPLGAYLDDDLRRSITDRCEVLSLEPGDVLIGEGEPVGSLYLIATGTIELAATARAPARELGSGDFVFPSQLLAFEKAPREACAGSAGALVLHAARHATHELLVSVPPLLELLSR